ncbi:MAG: cell division protein ZapA [SAR86 cluster bacterium]|jgi:cell division protein ZapA|nr:cell division protein ZapA [SAR86 cluster bacterium]|tara:strand:+ start:18771 stop:19076 length:306 start_codon:yes stop_codon:yes gene_type:complete
MNEPKKIISIEVLGQSYKISCEDSERDELRESAEFLDNKLKEIRQNSQLDENRAAIIVGLNIARELLKIKNNLIVDDATSQRIDSLNNKLKKQLISLKEID